MALSGLPDWTREDGARAMSVKCYNHIPPLTFPDIDNQLRRRLGSHAIRRIHHTDCVWVISSQLRSSSGQGCVYSEGLTLSALTVNGKVNASAAIYEANAGTGPGVTRAGAAELRSEINVRSGESYPKCLGFYSRKNVNSQTQITQTNWPRCFLFYVRSSVRILKEGEN